MINEGVFGHPRKLKYILNVYSNNANHPPMTFRKENVYNYFNHPQIRPC